MLWPAAGATGHGILPAKEFAMADLSVRDALLPIDVGTPCLRPLPLAFFSLS
jgi:hypothetical protein